MSVIEATPPKSLPPGAAPVELEALLLRVFAAEQPYRSDTSSPGLDELCNDLASAGFVLLGERDAALAETLQPTAAERLAVRPQLGRCDPWLAAELDAESWASDGSVELLELDGRVLVWRRGYGSETQEGRLLLEKLDYLQEQLVDSVAEAAAGLARRLMGRGAVEAAAPGPEAAPTAQYNRTSLADALDTPAGLLSALVSRSLLSEPTFDELVVAWRPQPARSSTARRVWRDADGRLSVTELAQAVRSPRGLRAAARTPRASTAPLELRLLRAIPIANWQLVLPFSRPSFQLKDWARLDLVTPPAPLAPISRPYLAHISRISRAYLAHISPISRRSRCPRCSRRSPRCATTRPRSTWPPRLRWRCGSRAGAGPLHRAALRRDPNPNPNPSPNQRPRLP